MPLPPPGGNGGSANAAHERSCVMCLGLAVFQRRYNHDTKRFQRRYRCYGAQLASLAHVEPGAIQAMHMESTIILKKYVFGASVQLSPPPFAPMVPFRLAGLQWTEFMKLQPNQDGSFPHPQIVPKGGASTSTTEVAGSFSQGSLSLMNPSRIFASHENVNAMIKNVFLKSISKEFNVKLVNRLTDVQAHKDLISKLNRSNDRIKEVAARKWANFLAGGDENGDD